MKTIIMTFVLCVGVLAGASALSAAKQENLDAQVSGLGSRMVLASNAQPGEQSPGLIDHSSLMSSHILSTPNPGPAAIAAYGSPPH